MNNLSSKMRAFLFSVLYILLTLAFFFLFRADKGAVEALLWAALAAIGPVLGPLLFYRKKNS